MCYLIIKVSLKIWQLQKLCAGIMQLTKVLIFNKQASMKHPIQRGALDRCMLYLLICVGQIVHALHAASPTPPALTKSGADVGPSMPNDISRMQMIGCKWHVENLTLNSCAKHFAAQSSGVNMKGMDATFYPHSK